ncbi:tyrosine-type recombinase/integrase [Actinocrispum wychmicini]|uniref:tyrosine-type recombinase/integrase n=1 Tax=Actinocrispum wychmicini TaxID=1213861 RepID=UPI00312C9D57
MVLPEFLRTLLRVRCPVSATTGAGAAEPVFPSGTLSWRHPSNVQRSIRRLRERIKYPTFVTHVGRKTVATALDQAGHTARQVADQLGHSNSRTTEKHHIEQGLGNPAAAADIDALHRRTS